MGCKFSKMIPFAAAAIASLATTSCDMPRDPQRTTDLVTETGTIRLGWVEGADADEHVSDALANLKQRTSADLEITRGDSEKVFGDLAGGRIDLVYGEFPMDSPWSKEVYFGRALGWRARAPKHEPVSRFAMRNGENGWIMLVEEAARP